MPRPNKRREVFAEEHLAERIVFEREARGWTLEGLAKRMTDAGCPMTGSAIYKIEKASPRRRIVVDELVAFAKVFGEPLDELLVPQEVIRKRELIDVFMRWSTAEDAAATAIAERDDAWAGVEAFAKANPDAGDTLAMAFEVWAEHRIVEDSRPMAIALRMAHLTESPEWRSRLQTLVNEWEA